MRVLVACEWSGRVRDQFRMLGHDAYSCDMDATDAKSLYPEYHIQGDAREYLDKDWDLIVSFPPCTYLSVAGNRTFIPNWRLEERARAIEFVHLIWAAPAGQIAIENPVGILSSVWQKPTQIIEPYWFGDPYTKRTCLWLKGLPKLERDPERYVHGAVTPWVRNRSVYMGGIANDPKLRGKTFPGIARAMAMQWGGNGE